MRILMGFTLVLAFAIPRHAAAQDISATGSVPRIITVSGTYEPAFGQPAGVRAVITLAVYAQATGGTALFEETQEISLGANGRYAAEFGATQREGLPATLFADGSERWLGVRFAGPGEVEGPRKRLTSVPYALRAADAETLGGHPASAYVLSPTAAGDSRLKDPDGVATTAAQDVLPGTPNALAKYVSGADVGSSAVVEMNGLVGIGTSTPLDSLHVRFTNTNGGLTGLAVQNLGAGATSYSGMLFYDQNGALGQFQGFNNATHEYRINNIATNSGSGLFDGSINFMVGGSSKFLIASNGDVTIPGSLLRNGVPYMRSVGGNSTYLGLGAGTNLGALNVGIGYNALHANSAGLYNAAFGAYSLENNTQGEFNVAVGTLSLEFNSTGSSNTAVGTGALQNTTTGSSSVAVGDAALRYANGSNNVAIGFLAGSNVSVGSNNIYLGANVFGTATDTNTMYLGAVGTQTRTFMAGVRGTTTGASDAVAVVIDSSGQLGTVNSSRRYKEDIQDMGDASSGLMKLRPVTFRYTQPYLNGTKPLDYGLIAEEVESVYPELVAHLANGEVETVQYHKINAMLLNEVQKQDGILQQLRGEIQSQAKEIELLKARLLALEAGRK